MAERYKVPWHVRQFVKRELMDYKANKKMLAKYKDYGEHTRELVIAVTRLSQIETVLNRLNKEDREAAEIIFFDKYTQVGAEVAKGLSKAAYYNAMNKTIYLVAKEFELI